MLKPNSLGSFNPPHLSPLDLLRFVEAIDPLLLKYLVVI